jgi:excinuclease ABC subunit A
LFSFNSPQGMCPSCDGLGEMFSFDPAKLAPDLTKSFATGAIELIGPWAELGRWKRHIYAGVAETMDRKLGLAEGHLLETPWRELDEAHRRLWLWGAGDEHITFTWRAGKNSQKYGGRFEGIIPELLDKYRTAKAKSLIAKLESYMNVIGCPDCGGERLNPQARSVKLASLHPSFADNPARTLPEVCRLPVGDASAFFSELALDATQQKIAHEALKEIRGRPSQRRARLLEPGPHGAYAFRRRVATHPPRGTSRLRPGRRHLHPRRAVDRPAPARQRTPARHAPASARPRQHGRRRRA